jgi:broad specificity phosphatase PhoE
VLALSESHADPVRHGARLDQADTRWHLTSPTPYDPPLTYGGWTQARALGARIGGILRAREEEEEATKDNGADGSASPVHTARKRQRKHKVIIHSSPFARCVQTSIAISAGIAQFRGRAPLAEKHHVMYPGSSHLPALEDSPRLSAISTLAEELPPVPSLTEPSQLLPKSQPAASLASDPPGPFQSGQHRVAELRLDAFLGEWLSPDYFENITPPPGSVMMVASAKAELLRPGEAIEGANPGTTTRGNFPGGWSMDWSPASSADESEEKTGLANMAALGHALPNRTRSSTRGSDSPGSYKSPRRHPTRLHTTPAVTSNPNVDPWGYVPPVPTYAISPSDPIPVGYVAHARDACISVSYQWDSMRMPQCWGNGGEYGEEWSAMHRRFRNGLSKMMKWYEEHGTAVNKAAAMFLEGAGDEEEDEAEAAVSDTVLILVTHGAGCNALLGALTNQPVLLDVGMASLTMAVRKEGARTVAEKRERRMENEVAASTQTQRRNSKRGSVDLGIAEDYEMKFTASTEHLRAGSNPLATSSAASPRIGSSTSNSPYRRSATSFCGDNFTIGEGVHPDTVSAGPSKPMTAGAASATGGGGLPRNVSKHSALRDVYPSKSAGKALQKSSGLWRSGTGTSLGGSSRSSSNHNHDGETSESGGENHKLQKVGNTAADTAGVGKRVLSGGGLDGANDVDLVLELKAGNVDAAPEVGAEQQRGRGLGQRPAKGTVNGASGALTPSDLMKTPSHTPTRTASQKGLWGGGGGASVARERDREAVAGMQKRRWTAVENTAA